MRLFFDIVRASYLGESYRLGQGTFNLSPRIPHAYDFSRRISRASDEYERLMQSLDRRFRAAARSDLYRKDTGWLDRGEREAKIRVIDLDGEKHVLPVLSGERTVAVDTSAIDNTNMVVGIFYLPDYQSAYEYLEKHLVLPKTHNHSEYHWSKLSKVHRRRVLASLPILLRISCDAMLVIKTDALLSPSGKYETSSLI